MGMKKANLLGMMLMMGAISNPEDYGTFEQEKKIKKPKKKIIPKGLTEFFYGENSLWALNQKNADRKARKKGWLIHSVVVPKGTLCDVCGGENTIGAPHMGGNCLDCNPL